MKAFVGSRDAENIARVQVQEDGRSYPLDPRLDVWNHSPTGFEWGYGGSGPAQLALAILCECLEYVDQAVALHQVFKRRVVARLPRNSAWEISKQQVLRWAFKARQGQLVRLAPHLMPLGHLDNGLEG
jgi:Family of unknown function (DUF6166)